MGLLGGHLRPAPRAQAFFGQSVSSTLQQVVFAFAVGLMYYVTRRLTGTLIVTMGLHAIWDFSVFI